MAGLQKGAAHTKGCGPHKMNRFTKRWSTEGFWLTKMFGRPLNIALANGSQSGDGQQRMPACKRGVAHMKCSLTNSRIASKGAADKNCGLQQTEGSTYYMCLLRKSAGL